MIIIPRPQSPSGSSTGRTGRAAVQGMAALQEGKGLGRVVPSSRVGLQVLFPPGGGSGSQVAGRKGSPPRIASRQVRIPAHGEEYGELFAPKGRGVWFSTPNFNCY